MRSRWSKGNWLCAVLCAAFVVGAAFWLDESARHWIASHQSRPAKIFMRNVSRFGDWPEHVAAGLVLAAIAWQRGRKEWVRIFLAMIVACALAGVAARAVKIATGRARPSVKSEEAWNGPRFSSKYNAFPSGHTASSTAFFFTLFLARRRIGLPLLAIPLLIAASRMYVAAHYFSDVTVAALLGVVVAYLVAQWLLPRRVE